jgi:hypothetical protein
MLPEEGAPEPRLVELDGREGLFSAVDEAARARQETREGLRPAIPGDPVLEPPADDAPASPAAREEEPR